MGQRPRTSVRQFGLGGRSCGRGYASSALVGDDGYCKPRAQSPKALLSNAVVQQGQFYGFYDVGGMDVAYDDIPESYKRQGRSVGSGATLDIYQHVLLSFEYSRILEEDDLVTASHSG